MISGRWPRVELLVAPPHGVGSFPYRKLAQADIIYFRLHGKVGQSYMYDGSFHTAFSLRRFEESGVRLRAGLVFIENCQGGLTPFPQAFRKAGAAIVVAAVTETQNYRRRIGPAGRIGIATFSKWLRGLRNPAHLGVVSDEMEFIVFD